MVGVFVSPCERLCSYREGSNVALRQDDAAHSGPMAFSHHILKPKNRPISTARTKGAVLHKRDIGRCLVTTQRSLAA